MGARLLEMYKKAEELGSLKAKMRLAMLTGIPSTRAGETPDSPDAIAKFEAALAELKKEFK